MNNIIAENIKRGRKKLGLTQEELGKMLGYSEKSISKWESGNGTPPTVILPSLARALKIDIDLLFADPSESLFYLGIDGGGTKTEFALADSNGNIINTLFSGTSNPSDIGIQSALEVLKTGIMEICDGRAKSHISVFAGLAGGTTEGIAEQIGQFLNGFGFAHTGHGSDAENAVAAGLGTENGISVIMGTGSVTYAQRAKKQYRVGGYGYLFGDAGSGFAFGRDAILAALQFEDGSGEYTAIYETVKKRCESEKVLEKLGSFYEGGKRVIAQYASCLFDAYEKGDGLAKDILQKNIEAIAQTIRGAAKHIPKTSMPIPVVLGGGIANAYEDIIIPMLYNSLANDTQKYNVSVCKRRMVYGALMLAGLSATIKKENESC